MKVGFALVVEVQLIILERDYHEEKIASIEKEIEEMKVKLDFVKADITKTIDTLKDTNKKISFTIQICTS